MDNFLSMLGDQVMKCAIRSGIALTSTLAINQSYRLLDLTSDKDIRDKYKELQEQFDSKIKIISPAIDLVEFKSIHGNVFLEAAAPLAKSLHEDIVALSKRINDAAVSAQPKTITAWHLKNNNTASAGIIQDMKTLICRMDREIPLLQLAISASGESFSSSIPPSVSPSRLLQASTFVTMGDTQFASNPLQRVQIGPQFVLSVYMLFTAHMATPTQGDGTYQHQQVKLPVWQEAIHKSTVRIFRKSEAQKGVKSPGIDSEALPRISVEYSYELEIVEDLNDERVHSEENLIQSDDQHRVGILETIPIQQISRLFYTNSGKILNLGDGVGGNFPVLLLKREIWCPSETSSRNEEDQNTKNETMKSRLPPHLDPVWIALQIFGGDYDSGASSEAGSDADSTSEDDEEVPRGRELDLCERQLNGNIKSQLNNISLDSEETSHKRPLKNDRRTTGDDDQYVGRSPFHAITTSLSLIEMIIRLVGLQESQQMSHLSIPDHILTCFLDQLSNTVVQDRSNMKSREQMHQTIGFDPTSNSQHHGAQSSVLNPI